jgi:O-methyltransferase
MAPPHSPAADLADRYLDLVERALMNEIVGESRLETAWRMARLRFAHPWRTRKWRSPWPARALTMLSRAQLTHLRGCVETALGDAIPGDFIETGVWRGGACILMRASLAAYGVSDRRVFVADSFEGLPRPDPRYPADRKDALHAYRELAISEAEVRRNFAAFGLLDEQVVFLKGLFKDTLPGLGETRFALIRLDGDMYESTLDALSHLYDRLNVGGFTVIDDYGALAGCRRAVHDFLDARGLSPRLAPIDRGAVWWRKD